MKDEIKREILKAISSTKGTSISLTAIASKIGQPVIVVKKLLKEIAK